MLYQVSLLWHEDYNSVGANFDTRAQAVWYAMTGEQLDAAQAALALGGYMAKANTAKAIVDAVKTLSTVNDLGPDLVAEYFDVGTFTDEDVASLGITATQLASCITLLEQVGHLMNNEATVPAMYRATLNLVRRI